MIKLHDHKPLMTGYAGLRMTADEFLALPESEVRYELVDGVVLMSPGATNRHQMIVFEIGAQFVMFLRDHPVGRLSGSVDFKLGTHTVYQPDVLYLSEEKASRCGDKITVPPDIAVEVISPQYRSYDSKTKRADYEAAGVGEYWLIDPERQCFTFLVLREGRYVEVQPAGDRYASTVLVGFQLDLAMIRTYF